MKPAMSLLMLGPGLLAAATAAGQTVHPANAPTTAVTWQPAASHDALAVDVDGDNAADLTFSDANAYPTGAGQPTVRTFSIAPAAGTELALDSAEYDSAHRYQAGQPVSRAVRWQAASGYIAYTVLGNGGLGGRGFFRDGQAGYVVVRKSRGGAWRYWWFNVKAATYGFGTSTVSFYGQSAALATAATGPRPATALPAYPNPTTSGWHLPGEGRYRLQNLAGQLLGAGTLGSATFIDAQALAPGLYLLLVELPDGRRAYQQLVRH